MVHTRQSTIKRKKYVLPPSNNLNNTNIDNTNIDNNEVSNLVHGTTDSIIVPETQTQASVASKAPKVSFRAPETPTKGTANLCGKVAVDELGKTPVTDITTGGKSLQETLYITMTPDDICMSFIKSQLYKDFEYHLQFINLRRKWGKCSKK